jgi:hypothetical protein
MIPVTPTIPVTSATPTTTPLEPSFADLIAAIEQANGLPEQRRLHWVCSLRQIAKWLNRPSAVIPARWQAVRISVVQLHHARVGVTPKTLAITSPIPERRCAGSAMSTMCRSRARAYRRNGCGSATGWTSRRGAGFTA